MKYKVLSLLQPWASLIVLGHKTIETRGWSTEYRGELLIHASMPKKKKESVKMLMDWRKHFELQDLPPYLSQPFGAIIGKVNLIDTLPTDTIVGDRTASRPGPDGLFVRWELTEKEFCFGDYSPNRYAWLLSDVERFERPIPAKGALSIWDWQPATL